MTADTNRIKRAITCVDEERSILQEEREAFRELRAFLRSQQPVNSVHSGAPATRAIVQNRGSSAEFIDAYQRTVMGVDHYESQYGEPIEENIAVELGTDISAVIRANAEIDPLVYRKLLLAIEECLRRRSQLLDVLVSERNYLETAIRDCRRIDHQLTEIPNCRAYDVTFDELEHQWNRLLDLESRCEQLVQSRQQFITERPTGTLEMNDYGSFNGYIYESIDTQFPVLETVLELFGRIERRR